MVLSLTLMPVLARLLLPKKVEEREPFLMRIAHAIHYPILQFAMHHKLAVLGFAARIVNRVSGLLVRRQVVRPRPGRRRQKFRKALQRA